MVREHHTVVHTVVFHSANHAHNDSTQTITILCLTVPSATRVPVYDRYGLKTSFLDEGKFKARVLGEDEEFPEDDVVDISSIKVPVSTECTGCIASCCLRKEMLGLPFLVFQEIFVKVFDVYLILFWFGAVI